MRASLFVPLVWIVSAMAAGRLICEETATQAAPGASAAPGHSMNGDAFDDGPRQAAVLMPGMGHAHFPVTTKVEAAQLFFDQGLGQLHGFWYFEAERSFRQAAALDPGCAMAYWGMAMANVNNPQRAAKFIKEAAARQGSASRREQQWVAAFSKYFESKKDEHQSREALVRALEELTFDFPDDLEAKAFLTLQIWDNKGHGVPLPSRRAVDALADEVLRVDPQHPGLHHYRIHLWNGAGGDKHALNSAAQVGQSAPGIAHLWHMAGHTFSNLKRYADAAWQQEASARVDHAYMMSQRVLPDLIHNFAHNNDWLVTDLEYVGRVREAVDLAKNMIELPRPGSRNGKSYQLGRERLLETLLRFELWDELAALDGSMYLDSTLMPDGGPAHESALAAAYFRTGQTAKGQGKIAALETLLQKRRSARLAAGEAAEAKAEEGHKSEEEVAKALAEALRQAKAPIKEVENALNQAQLYQALAAGEKDAARKLLGKATTLPAERRARLAMELGDRDEAVKLARDAAASSEGQTAALATLADILRQAGKPDEALAAFQKLRPLAAQVDLESPLFARLAPLAEAARLPTDWRPPLAFPADSGVRPALAELGPFRWRPSPAPSWSLPDSAHKMTSLSDFAGKPVLVVFYLGSGCSHCVEQLNVFAPMAAKYAAAGIAMVAVSTDTPDGLFRTFVQSAQTEGFPFPIVADPSLGAFKAYRAYDDFEKTPLHGSFLIDGAGLVRWQDIGPEPFRDAEWLLGESKRLLSIILPNPLAER